MNKHMRILLSSFSLCPFVFRDKNTFSSGGEGEHLSHDSASLTWFKIHWRESGAAPGDKGTDAHTDVIAVSIPSMPWHTYRANVS